MPSMADITVKKYDGTTDIVWTAKVPSAGDKAAALWRSETVGGGVAIGMPELRVTTQYNGDKTARRGTVSFSYPIVGTDVNTGLSVVQYRYNGTLSFSADMRMSAGQLQEAGAQMANLLASTLMKSVLFGGFAPT